MACSSGDDDHIHSPDKKKPKPEQIQEPKQLAPDPFAQPDDTEPKPTPLTEVAPPTPDLVGAKPLHFSFLSAAKDTLLFADISGTQSSIAWISQDSATERSPKWQAHWQELQSSLQPLQNSTDIEELSAAIAQAGRSCGNCHTAMGISPTILVPEPKRRGLDFKDHMAGHRWALDNMWAGLATPSDSQWQLGADLLAGAPTHLRKLASYGKDASLAMKLATQVHSLAAQAKTETQSDGRTLLLGKFLAACAACHRLAGSEPSKDPL